MKFLVKPKFIHRESILWLLYRGGMFLLHPVRMEILRFVIPKVAFLLLKNHIELTTQDPLQEVMQILAKEEAN